MRLDLHGLIASHASKKARGFRQSLFVRYNHIDDAFCFELNVPELTSKSPNKEFELLFGVFIESVLWASLSQGDFYLTEGDHQDLCFSNINIQEAYKKLSSLSNEIYNAVVSELIVWSCEVNRTFEAHQFWEFLFNSESFVLEYIGVNLWEAYERRNCSHSPDYRSLFDLIESYPDREMPCRRIVAQPYPVYLTDQHTPPFRVPDFGEVCPSEKWPIGFEGFHSSWSGEEHNPTSSLQSSPRMKVALCIASLKTNIIWGDAFDHFPLLLKSNSHQGFCHGLTSGAGGALLSTDRGVLKIKRCGYKSSGIRDNSFHDKVLTFVNGSVKEESIYSPAGLAYTNVLLSELESIEQATKQGLALANKPIAIVRVDQEKDFSFLISEVLSDLRVDELVIALIKDKESGAARCTNLLCEVGKAEGVLYRKIHELGFIRGMGNSWFGNEAVLRDGSLLLCDIENCYHKTRIGTHLYEFYKKFEFLFFINAITCALGKRDTGDYAKALIEGFISGYESDLFDRNIRIPPEACEVLSRYFTTKVCN